MGFAAMGFCFSGVFIMKTRKTPIYFIFFVFAYDLVAIAKFLFEIIAE